ncbi:hypothetical protein BC939DRAFT_441758 [Gamsiella multidivaricata]|uniref:uncharacterized protein n=1 Tax=Gamsiella multidivaricata TaxID=101098 RepID=UPI0022206CE8|nr:uncharacterized protein BC939DRAFT_441758 [Gamsiella multidivaricata]KAG0358771.1 hypothetical protein BGZ54_010294 [Gamsiella multidivaricata]KAI7829390.1 hypothetical protein BC939DRAFT_441758 [Gamsiella multidivaricata]
MMRPRSLLQSRQTRISSLTPQHIISVLQRRHLRHISLVLLLSVLSTVSASITCALPAGGTYKAGDSVILDWGSDGTSPVVSDISSINGTLYCNANSAKIADVSIPNVIGPYNWTIPSVGNATTIGGDVGTCAQNAFHIEYSGEAQGFLGIVKIPWGPVRCGTITLMPAPNGTITTTTTTMSSTTTTSTPTATESLGKSDGGGISMTVIVIIAVVAAVLVTLLIVALVVFVRRHRRQRKLDNALMPWNASSSMNRFSKVSSTDDDSGPGSPRASGPGGHGMTSIAGAGAGAGLGAGVAGASTSSYELKPQPTIPQSSRGTYFQDDGDFGNYGYHQQQQQLLQHQHHGYGQQGYDGYNEEDAYYNPYYTGGAGLDAGETMNQSNPSFYSARHSNVPGSRVRSSFAQDGYQGGDLSQQEYPIHQQQQQQQHTSAYFPPPPPTSGPMNPSPNSSMQSYSRAAAVTGAGLTSTETGHSALTSLPMMSSSATSSPKRAPQTVVMQEMGRKEAEEEATKQEVEPLSPSIKVEISS